MQYHISRYAEMRFLYEAVGSTKNSENRTFEIHTQSISYMYGHAWGKFGPVFSKKRQKSRKVNFIYLRIVYKIEIRMIN